MPEGWEPTEECRIGSLPWFAGIFWLGLSYTASGLAWLAYKVHCHALCCRLIVASNKMCAAAARCAMEGGARV